jgi:hypothetical protein
MRDEEAVCHAKVPGFPVSGGTCDRLEKAVVASPRMHSRRGSRSRRLHGPILCSNKIAEVVVLGGPRDARRDNSGPVR